MSHAAAVLDARPLRTHAEALAPHPVVVLVPAHNEAGQIAETITSLLTQTRPPDRVVVIADNCADDTADIATARWCIRHSSISAGPIR